MKKGRTLTEHQTKFLDALGGEAQGNIQLALKLAGYAEGTSARDVTKSLREEILEVTLNLLAMNAPRAAAHLLQLLEDPNTPGATTKLKVIQDLLDRTGVVKKTEDVQLKVPQGGLFIMPAKGSNPVIDITPEQPKTIEVDYEIDEDVQEVQVGTEFLDDRRSDL